MNKSIILSLALIAMFLVPTIGLAGFQDAQPVQEK